MNIKILDNSNHQIEGVGKTYPSLIIVVGTPIVRTLQSHEEVSKQNNEILEILKNQSTSQSTASESKT